MTTWRLSKLLLVKYGFYSTDQPKWVANVLLLIWNFKNQTKSKNTFK